MISRLGYIYKSLRHYAGAHALVALGMAVATMVLTGALIIGDSMRSSLLRTVGLRLGNTAFVFTGEDRLFRKDLAADLQRAVDARVAAVMLIDGIASSQGGALRLTNINVWGIDADFRHLAPGDSASWSLPGPGEVLISENLANRLQLEAGQSMLLRMDKVNRLPKNAPFVSDDDGQVTVRVTVKSILDENTPGRFNLRASQTAPFNVFISIEYLNHLVEQPGRANRLLFSRHGNAAAEHLPGAIAQHWRLEDTGLHIDRLEGRHVWQITSDRVFMDSVVVQPLLRLDPNANLVLTYFANTLSANGNTTPYSFVSAGSFPTLYTPEDSNEILINTWLADDLGAAAGDTLVMEYFKIGPLRRLEERNALFTIKKVVPMEGVYADKSLMPDLPGLTDAGNCSDWNTGVPIDLDLIRDKDEAYWDRWKGTPKAFISYQTGKTLWQNRFGVCTAVRVPIDLHDRQTLVNILETGLRPELLGYRLEPVLERGLTAARSGVDFSQLFIGLSFFLLLAGLILMGLLLNLHLERRLPQAGTLHAMGYSRPFIRNLFVTEALLMVVPGIVLGGLLGILYNKLVFSALNTVWNEIVLTSSLQTDIQLGTITVGMAVSFLFAAFIVWYNVRKALKLQTADLQSGPRSETKRRPWITIAASLLTAVAFALLLYQVARGQLMNSGIFFAAGGLLLLTSLMFFYTWLWSPRHEGENQISLNGLAINGVYRNRSRSLRVAVLFALGTFIVISTGLNRKDLHSGALQKSSGTGGFLFYGETTLPVLKDLNSRRVQIDLGLDSSLHFVQLRKTEGDDASCLNLNRVTQPRILGVQPETLYNRFSMVKALPQVDPAQPWTALSTPLPEGMVPAIADQTVILWGLGKKVGDTLSYTDGHGNTMTLKLVAGLANSIFQGNVLIDEDLFIEHFPESSGSHVLLIDGDRARADDQATLLNRVFRSEGLDLTVAADRLARFNSVENTYLSIFLMLGGLGMILGAIGLGITLARNILDRRKEIALLVSLGYSRRTLLTVLAKEHMFLLAIGTLSGAITAIIATLPSILSDYVQASWQTAGVIVLLIVLNGLIWMLLIAGRYIGQRPQAALQLE